MVDQPGECVICKLLLRLTDDVKLEGVNFFLADGEVAGQEVFHAHLHVFPRFKDDGFRQVLPPGHEDRPPRADLEELATLIRNKLNS